MSKKLFISYSHKDEEHKDVFLEHLSSSIRNGLISEWHDRKISPGQNWSEVISSALENSEIIIFLISSSFLDSEYCQNIEVMRAMEMHNQGKAKLIPIIIRPCEWMDSDFASFQALPKDAKPITEWDNTDRAWVNVVTGLKNYIKEFAPLPLTTTPKENEVKLTDQTFDWLEDTEIVLTHRRVNRVLLSQVFVVPDIEVIDEQTDENEIKSSQFILSKSGKYLVSGDEQQGKTSLLKYFFKESLKQKSFAIYIDAEGMNKCNLMKSISKALKNHYIGLDIETVLAHEKKVIFIDNFDAISLNSKYQEIFLKEIHEYFDDVVITCHSSFDLISSELESFADYSVCRLANLGNLKREELAKKWISLGIEESIDDDKLYKDCDELKFRLNGAIKKNLLPSKPINVLMLIQIFEASQRQNLELTSYGHCYQELIYKSLAAANVKNLEYDKYFNVMTELAWTIFNNQQGLNSQQEDIFFDKYEQTFLSVDRGQITKNLLQCRVLEKKNNQINFKFTYIFYFFVGKKVAESYSSSEKVTKEVDYFIEHLHREDYANILIFITHHTREAWLISKINEVLNSLFIEQEQATLRKDQLSFMSDFIKAIPELVLEQREIQDERDAHNKRLDEIERLEEPEESEPLDILATINKTLKGMDIAGQIIRNRHASLTRADIHKLAESCISTGLRFLDYFIRISDSAKREIIDFIRERIEEHPNLSNNEIGQKAEYIYLQMTYGTINAIVRKIASLVGSKDAKEIFKQLEKEKATPAYTLVNQAIELQYTRSLDIESIDKTLEQVYDNPVCLRILKEMVIQHVYMFPVDYRDKQKLSDKLGFSMKQQRLMDQKTRGKG